MAGTARPVSGVGEDGRGVPGLRSGTARRIAHGTTGLIVDLAEKTGVVPADRRESRDRPPVISTLVGRPATGRAYPPVPSR